MWAVRDERIHAMPSAARGSEVGRVRQARKTGREERSECGKETKRKCKWLWPDIKSGPTVVICCDYSLMGSLLDVVKSLAFMCYLFLSKMVG